MKLKSFLHASLLIGICALGGSSFASPALPQRHLPETLPATQNVDKSNNNSYKSSPKKIDPKLRAKLDAEIDGVSEGQYQKVVAEYKQYLKSVSPDVRHEIILYRQEVAEINKTKIALYKKLSQQAQQFLAKERELKKKLPIKDRSNFTRDIKAASVD